MPPAKVQIRRIEEDLARRNTFHKRKMGLIKKAMDLSVLCDCDCAVILKGPAKEGGIMAYCNQDLQAFLRQCIAHMPSHVYSNSEYARFSKNGPAATPAAEHAKVPATDDQGAGAAGGGTVASDWDPAVAQAMAARLKALECEVISLRQQTKQNQLRSEQEGRDDLRQTAEVTASGGKRGAHQDAELQDQKWARTLRPASSRGTISVASLIT